MDFCVSLCLCVQEEELQELCSQINVCREEFEAARDKVLTHKKEYEEADQLCRQQREAFNSIAEEAEPIKVREYLSLKNVCNIISGQLLSPNSSCLKILMFKKGGLSSFKIRIMILKFT